MQILSEKNLLENIHNVKFLVKKLHNVENKLEDGSKRFLDFVCIYNAVFVSASVLLFCFRADVRHSFFRNFFSNECFEKIVTMGSSSSFDCGISQSSTGKGASRFIWKMLQALLITFLVDFAVMSGLSG